METNIKLITIFDKHEDFIKIQYESILRYVKGNYTYIVFNNASTEDQAIKNKQICDELGITCIRIHVNYNNGPSNIAGESLNVAFNQLKNEIVFKIDSDMFFMGNININTLFNESDIIYIPNLQLNREIMWSGVFGINLKKVDINLDFNPGVISGTDTFGQSCLLTTNPKYKKRTFELYNLQSIEDGVMTTALNNDCVMKFKDDELIFNERPEIYKNQELYKTLVTKYNIIVTKLKQCSFPEPYNIDIIEMGGVDFIFHFKSANWCPWYTDQYVNEKKISLIKLLNT
jgi:hypothetical protein